MLYIMDKNFSVIGTLENYISFIFSERYNDAGSFEITLSDGAYPFLIPGNFLYSKTLDDTLSIETISRGISSFDKKQLTLTGRDMSEILDRRSVVNNVLYSSPETEDTPPPKVKIQDYIHKLINDNVIDPKDPRRKISNFVFIENTDPRLSEIEIDAYADSKSLLTVIHEISESKNVGFKTRLNTDTKNIEFKLRLGENHATNLTSPVIGPPLPNTVLFSTVLETITDENYTNSHESFKNRIYVSNAGIPIPFNREVASGLDLREGNESTSYQAYADTGLTYDEAFPGWEEFPIVDELLLPPEEFDPILDLDYILKIVYVKTSDGRILAKPVFLDLDFFGDWKDITPEGKPELMITHSVVHHSSGSLFLMDKVQKTVYACHVTPGIFGTHYIPQMVPYIKSSNFWVSNAIPPDPLEAENARFTTFSVNPISGEVFFMVSHYLWNDGPHPMSAGYHYFRSYLGTYGENDISMLNDGGTDFAIDTSNLMKDPRIDPGSGVTYISSSYNNGLFILSCDYPSYWNYFSHDGKTWEHIPDTIVRGGLNEYSYHKWVNIRMPVVVFSKSPYGDKGRFFSTPINYATPGNGDNISSTELQGAILNAWYDYSAVNILKSVSVFYDSIYTTTDNWETSTLSSSGLGVAKGISWAGLWDEEDLWLLYNDNAIFTMKGMDVSTITPFAEDLSDILRHSEDGQFVLEKIVNMWVSY